MATPRKNVGLVFPSIWCPNPCTSTNVPFCSATFCEMPVGYISDTEGRKIADGVRINAVSVSEAFTLSDMAERSSRSRGRVLGYVARSSCGANCAGLTKIDTTVFSLAARDFLTVGDNQCRHATGWMLLTYQAQGGRRAAHPWSPQIRQFFPNQMFFSIYDTTPLS